MLVAGGWGNTPRESPSQAGIFRTSDGGAHWSAAVDGLTNPDGTISSAVNGLWLDQSDPSIVLAATEFGGTFRSTDGGASWHNVDRSEATQFAQVGATLYLASRRGVLVSHDGGAAWHVALASKAGATTVVTAAGATFAGDARGNVFQLQRGRWRRTGHPGTGAIHDIAIDPFDTQTVYANVDDRRAWNQILYGSVDGATTWTRVDCECSIGAQAIAFSKVTAHRLYVGDDGGNGAIRYLVADGSAHPRMYDGARTRYSDVRYIFVVKRDARSESCYFVADQGLFRDDDCTAGRPAGLSNGIANFLAYDVALTRGGRNIAVPLQDYNATSASSGGAFHNVSGVSEGGESFLNPYDASACYVAHPDDGLFASRDGCGTFARRYDKGIESLAFAPPNGNAMYAILRDDLDIAHVGESRDGGATWTPKFPRLANPYQIVVSPLSDRSLFVAAGTARGPNAAYVSGDGGVHWKQSRGLPQMGEAIQQYFPAHRFYAAYDPADPATVVLADHDPDSNDVIVYRSRDGGATFSKASTLHEPPTQRPWPNMRMPDEDARTASMRYYAQRFYANRLAFDPQPQACRSDLVLTARFGAFESFDRGSSWHRIDTTATPHHFIGVHWSDGALYLASFGGGVLERMANGESRRWDSNPRALSRPHYKCGAVNLLATSAER